MKEVVIIDAVRTPVGSFGGSLKEIPAVELGAIVVKELIRRTGIDPAQVEELIFGCVLQAAQGQNVARQVLIRSGIPKEVPAMTINKVCASGLGPFLWPHRSSKPVTRTLSLPVARKTCPPALMP